MANFRTVTLYFRNPNPSLLCRVADGILNLLYPESCVACACAVSTLQDCGICRRCREKILQLRIAGPLCPSCGLPYRTFADGEAHLCGRCTMRLPPYSGARAFGWYGSELSRAIQALKFGGRRNLAGFLAALMAETLLEAWDARDIDLIVPVPLHPKRLRERGYNQAALLGRRLGRFVGLPCHAALLRRIRHTSPQVGLSDAERARNLRLAFRCARPDAARGMRILLVDDVMTTGATVASAAEALLAAGARRVSVLTAARAVAGPE